MGDQTVTSALGEGKARQGLRVCGSGPCSHAGRSGKTVRRCSSKDLQEVRGSSLQRSVEMARNRLSSVIQELGMTRTECGAEGHRRPVRGDRTQARRVWETTEGRWKSLKGFKQRNAVSSLI